MITRADILKLMPPVEHREVVKYRVNYNPDIIKTIHAATPRAVQITKPVAELFRGATDTDTCRNIWDFLKSQIRYVKDETNQDIKQPNRFVADGTGDCKSYSLFAASILQNLGIANAYRYASYTNNPTPQHVYTMAISGPGAPIIVDGVWHRFNEQKKFNFKKDFSMPIRVLSGIPGATPDQEIGKTKVGKFLSKVQDKAKGTAVVKAAAKAQDKAKGTAVVKAAAKAQSTVKKAGADAQNTVKAKAKEAQKNVVRIARKGSDALKNVAPGAKKVVGAPARRAFRTLVAANFHGFATKLQGKAEAFAMWKKLGGSVPELQKSINAGIKRRAILGIGCMHCKVYSKNQVGFDPGSLTTIAALIAAATPIIIALAGLLKENKSTLDAAAAAGGTVPDNPDGTDAGGSGSGGSSAPGVDYGQPSGGQYYQPTGGEEGSYNPETETASTKTESAPAEGNGNAGGLVLAAIAAKLLFF